MAAAAAVALGAGAMLSRSGEELPAAALPTGVEVVALIAKGSGVAPTERPAISQPEVPGRPGDALVARAEDILASQVRDAIAAARRDDGTAIALVEDSTTALERPEGRHAVRLDRRTEFGSPVVLAVVGQEGAWVEVMTSELDNGDTAWVHAGVLDLADTDFTLRADLSERRLEVRRRGRLARTIPIAVGGPATPTPTGRFAVTDKLTVPGGSAAYGCCALALTGHQPNIPQGWSGGDRLAVHATTHTATIGHAASLGCFRASEEHARWLVETVPLGTVIEVVD